MIPDSKLQVGLPNSDNVITQSMDKEFKFDFSEREKNVGNSENGTKSNGTKNQNESSNGDESNSKKSSNSESNQLVRSIKSITAISWDGQKINKKIVSKKYFNAFNYSKFPIKSHINHLAIGVTSPNKNEGKTLVACNLAASFALGFKKKTVIVDFNFNNPKLHEIFGIKNSPGLADSFYSSNIQLSQTEIPDLFVLPTGSRDKFSDGISLNDLMYFQKVIYSLEQHFEFIIIDMSSVIPIHNFPLQLVNEVNGLLVVVDTKKTKQSDIDKIFKQIDEKQILGFVFNRVDGNA